MAMTSRPLALGEVESLALPHESYGKAFTPSLLSAALEGRATDSTMAEGGYVRLSGDDPTSTFAYDLTRFASGQGPNVVRVRARERHGAANVRWQESYSYSDGSGHEVGRKVLAEPGLAPVRDGNGGLVYGSNGELVLVTASPRWVGSGRTVFDNKGNPVKQYEPFFSESWRAADVLPRSKIGRCAEQIEA